MVAALEEFALPASAAAAANPPGPLPDGLHPKPPNAIATSRARIFMGFSTFVPSKPTG
jgi:hypothetical protein